jgi:hypothetical protein
VIINWQGVYPAPTTQFRGDHSLDLDATAKRLDLLIRAGIHRRHLARQRTREHGARVYGKAYGRRVVDGRILVLTGVAENTTALVCRYARVAERLGLDGLMVLPGMGYQADRREAIAQFRTVARASGRRSSSTTTDRLITSTSRPKCSPSWPMSLRSRHQRVFRRRAPHHRSHQVPSIVRWCSAEVNGIEPSAGQDCRSGLPIDIN